MSKNKIFQHKKFNAIVPLVSKKNPIPFLLTDGTIVESKNNNLYIFHFSINMATLHFFRWLIKKIPVP